MIYRYRASLKDTEAVLAAATYMVELIEKLKKSQESGGDGTLVTGYQVLRYEAAYLWDRLPHMIVVLEETFPNVSTADGKRLWDAMTQLNKKLSEYA